MNLWNKRGRLLLVALATTACSSDQDGADGAARPREQWVVTIATDAPPPPFFDRVLVEVLDDSGALACGSTCRRVFGFTDKSTWPLSFGIANTIAARHVRARLYRSDHVLDDGSPMPPMLIDATGALPPLSLGAGVVRVELDLMMDCFGVAANLEGSTTCDPNTKASAPEPVLARPPTTPLMGSWPEGQLVDCARAAPEGMVCIPGGVFFLGGLLPGSPVVSTTPEHLVKLTPFALDVDEMTVGKVRELANRRKISADSELPQPQDPNPFKEESACTWLGKDVADNDELPVNCVSRSAARAICSALGKRLPTEAQVEWAAGNTTLETDFPWGADPDACGRAIVGRGRTSLEAPLSAATNTEIAGCRAAAVAGVLPWGPVAGGSALDVTILGVKNLGGNVSEWTADRFFSRLDDEGCWGRPTALITNPQCDQPDRRTTSGVARGGNWAFIEAQARVVLRAVVTMNADQPDGITPRIGFRCALPLDR